MLMIRNRRGDMSILIKGGRVIDPANDIDQVMDILIEDGRIKKAAKSVRSQSAEVIDAKGKWVMPGLVDLHVHLRDPGQTDKEDVESGSLAAAAGGFTSIVAMGNTKPVIDNVDEYSYVMNKAKTLSSIHIYQAGTLTKGMEGKELSDIRGMAEAGCIVFSEDGKSVMNSSVCLRAMTVLKDLDLPMLDHCEDIDLRRNGAINADDNALRLNQPVIKNLVEDIMVSRDAMLALSIGARVHYCHCSTERSVEIIRHAKKQHDGFTAEVTPHHLILTSDDIPESHDMVNYKMNPPLRTRKDVDALIEGLKDGTIDCIATDHAPHTNADKNESMTKAPFGIIGLETALPLIYTELVKKEIISASQMVEKMSLNPAKILKIEAGTLSVDAPADVTIFDPDEEWEIDSGKFKSKARNTPFNGRKVFGRVTATVAGGEVVYRYDA